MAGKEQHPLWALSEAYKAVSRTPEGELVLQDLVKRFGWTRQSTIDVDPLKMAWKEGTRAVVVHIGRMIDADIHDAADTTAERGVE
jgi:hypothetical protein